MERLLQRLAELSSEELKLLFLVLQQDGKQFNVFPLSFAQQRLWFLDQLEPDNPFYNMTEAHHIRGALSIAILEQCIQEIIRRHESIRTIFLSVEGQPMQAIISIPHFIMPVVDLSILSFTEQETEIQHMITLEKRRSFNLTHGPLLRVTLLRVTQCDHVLLLSLHHIISDGWSMRVFAKELATLFTAFTNNCPSPLPDLPIQYADFAKWQRDLLQGETLQKLLAYWNAQLADAPIALELPTDYLRPVKQAFRGTVQSWSVSRPHTEALKALSRREGVTLFMTLLAAFQILLARYTGVKDIVIGTRTAGRNQSELEGLIGFFINALPLRITSSGNPSFRELLTRVRDVTLDAFAHQDLPFEELVRELHPQRDLSINPIFQVMFTVHNFPEFDAEMAGMDFRPLYSDMGKGTARFDLSFAFYEEGEGLVGMVEYNTDLFAPATINSLIDHYRMLIERIVIDPDQRTRDILFLTQAEIQNLLINWNGSQMAVPAHTCLHDLFEEQAECTPESIAVFYEEEQLTYQELNERANQLAYYLKDAGVMPEVLVGVFVERSLTTLIALLAILKVGGVYVPLDPDYPSTYIQYILQDIHISVILTLQRLLWQLPPHQARVIQLDTDQFLSKYQPKTNSKIQVTPSTLFYVMYTSSSTGRSKGVAVEQRQLLNRFLWMWQAYPFTEDERTCQRSSMNTTMSIWEFLGPLLRGIPVVILSDRISKNIDTLIAAVEERGVTRIVIIPSLLRLILEIDEKRLSRLHRLKLWSVGGEELQPELVRRFYRQLPHAILLNQYGSTEMNDISVYDTRQLIAQSSKIPIGHPITNLQMYLLDQHLQLVPTGARGEIYVGSIAPARGYCGRLDLTAERFIPHQFSTVPGARLYRTGDIGRRLHDGSIEFLGRSDQQVKIRGFRVETGEVEAILDQHPDVFRSAVIASKHPSGDLQLAGYIVIRKGTNLTLSKLRDFLQKRVPAYMIPSVLIILDQLPMTPNGKLNRRALPAPDKHHMEMTTAYIAPTNEIEHAIVQIYQEVLHIEQIGIHDNFYELGGDSLSAMQVIFKVYTVFQLNIPLSDFLEDPTIKKISDVLLSKMQK